MLRAPALAEVRAEDHVSVLRLLAKRHRDLGRARNRTACRLHATIAELVAEAIHKELVTAQVTALLDGFEATSATQAARLEIAGELVEDLARLDAELKMSKRRLTDAVAASNTSLTDIFGIGPVLAGMIIGYTGDPTRFANADAYANYNGTAPLDRVLGPPQRAPPVEAWEPTAQPRYPHGRGHRDPLLAQPRPRRLRRQARGRQDQQRKRSER